ncbi:MAG TPA: HNH endonuclease domain-containing protein [Parafilimonas sp.]|nr:HNH endonuclease domain-containing protein [Parafilimonas sp.]
MKKILGLDIGTTSIGWAIVEAEEKKANKQTGETAQSDINNDRIGIYQDAIGVRIIPQDTDNITSFNKGEKLVKGSTLTPAAKRRKARGSRRMKSRYKLRRGKLIAVLSFLGMLPEGSYELDEKGKTWIPAKESQGNWYTKIKEFEYDEKGNKKRIKRSADIGESLYQLRNDAIIIPIGLQDWGRIILHLNQWRGYSSDRFTKEVDDNSDDNFYTSLVTSVVEKERIMKGKKNPKIEKIVFEIEFENGDKGIDIVSYGENSYTQFKIGKYSTYKKEINEKENGSKEVLLNWQKLKEDDWTYRKWKLNKGIDNYINEDKLKHTVGSYFYKFFYDSNTIQNERLDRIRNNVVDRDWYEDEFNKVWDVQFNNHKDYFEKFNIEDIVKIAFKDFQPIINEVQKKQGLKEQLKFLIKDKIIYYQRPWQQAKNKGECPFEFVPDVKREKDGTFSENKNGKKVIDKNGKEVFVKGRTVIPKSHPLYQEYRIWQQINNVRLFVNDNGEKHDLFDSADSFKKHTGKSVEETKQLLFTALQENKTISWRNFAKDTLGVKNIFDELENKQGRKIKKGIDTETGEIANSYYSVNFRKKKKDGSYDDIRLKGNATRYSFQTILKDKNESWFNEIHSNKQAISNLQFLWELIYDITIADKRKLAEKIKLHFDFDDAICEKLSSLQFDDKGMGNLSAKAIRQLLPLMSNGNNPTDKAAKRVQSLIHLNISEKDKNDDQKLGSIRNFVTDKKARIRLSRFSKIEDFKYLNYWEAAAVMYGSHSTKNTQTQSEITRVKQHSMNNPVVEKIVNETISIVNEINKVYGFDEVRIELSRELKASMDERQQMWEGAKNGYDKNEWAKQMLRELKKALQEDNRSIANIDDEPTTNSNLDKIKIMEDVVKFQRGEEYKKKEKEWKLDEPSKAEITKYLLWLEQNFKCPYTNQPIPLTDIFAKGKIVEIEHILPKERYYSNAYSNKVITWRQVNLIKGSRTAYEFIVSRRIENSIKVATAEYPLVEVDKWQEHIESMFPKGAKRNNLLRKDIPEDPIERTLKETQYINKKLKEKFAELVGESKVWITSGSVTDILREKWHLNDVMKDLLRERFENFNIGESKKRLNLIHWTTELNTKTGKYEPVEKFTGYSKRVDHRHHALDAIIIACTKQSHIQYINNLNKINTVDQDDDEAKKHKYLDLKKEICENNSSSKFKTPWDNNENNPKKNRFVADIKKVLSKVIISHKNTRLLISPSKHRIDKNIDSGKVASLRGELHKETNYARRNYYIEGSKLEIDKLVSRILNSKFYNQQQVMVVYKTFEYIIKETVLKEKYQKLLLPYFTQYNKSNLNDKTGKKADDNSISIVQNKILKEIQSQKTLIDTKTGKPLQWLSVYTNKDKASRPLGLSMDLNSAKEVKDIADPKIKRLAEYRLQYVNDRISFIDKLDSDKKEKDKLKAIAKSLKLYSNAVYEVRLKTGDNQFIWVELKDLKDSDIDNISYAKNETTKFIKEKLSKYQLSELKKTYFEEPIFISNNPIEIKKVRQKSFFQDLYEITNNRYVYSRDIFMTYIFKEKGESNLNCKRKIEFLKFLDAIKIVSFEKPEKINYYELQTSNDLELMFTISKGDLIFLPEKNLVHEEIEDIEWNNREELMPFLYIVKDMEASNKKIVFQQFYKADSIEISENDAKELFQISSKNGLKEEIKYGTTDMLQRCIKVFTDKLGKKIVPYWKFKNGCWNKEDAERLGLVPSKK